MKQIQTSIENLSNLCAESRDVYFKYTDKDLFNATYIFTHIFLAKMYDYHKNNLSQKYLKEIAKESGEAIRQLILTFTGKDMHKIK